jgi:ribonuclease D
MNQNLPHRNRIPQASPLWIDSAPKLAQLIKDLTSEPLVAVDTESDSLYSYFEKVCLVQFSTSQADYLVDPLSIDVSELGHIFANPAIQKVFHAAEYDILSLKRDYNFSFSNLFDTMLAAKILGWPRYGLGSILADHFQVKLDKRFQRYDWGQRPLSPKALDYARLDTYYLLPLRSTQRTELEQQNRLQESSEAFERQTLVEPSPKVFDPDDFWRIKNSRELKPQQQSVLRELYITRDKIARKIDRPPFKILNDSTLLELAVSQPKDPEALKRIKGISTIFLKHNSQDILSAIEKGENNTPPRYHSHNDHRPDDETLSRYETLRHWRNTLASERGVEPDVIFSNGILMHIARHNPKSFNALSKLKGLGNWQREKYGKALLKVLRQAA